MEGKKDQSPPQLQAVVVITLPPADNPSLGKTITAITLSDPSSPQSHDHNHAQLVPLPIRSPPDPDLQLSLSFSRPFLGSASSRALLGFLGVSIFALMLFYTCVLSQTLVELRNRNPNEEDGPKSFLFPLYRKSGLWEVSPTAKSDVELKLGRFVAASDQNVGSSLDSQKIKEIVLSSRPAVDATTIFPVRGNVYPDGLYFTYLLVGNPSRPYYLDIDTGSDLTWIQCDAPCISCGKGAHTFYKPKRGNMVPFKDSLCSEVQRNQNTGQCETCYQCDYEIEYADHSSSLGVLARDELRLIMSNGSLTKSDVVFGCAYDQQGILLNTLGQTDGILGLSRGRVSLPSQLAKQGIINNVVGHCLATDASDGGYMFLGDDFVPHWGMVWIPMLNNPSIDIYASGIVRMSYGSSWISIGGSDSRVGRVVFDSGSSYTYFTKQAYSELLGSLKVSEAGFVRDASDPTLPFCWRSKFPIRSVIDVKPFFKTLTLHFWSKWWVAYTKLSIPPEGYLIISKKGNVCLGILDASQVHDGSTIILGDISLRGKLVAYDNVNHKIGWMQSDCAKPQVFKNLPFFDGAHQS